MTQVSDPNIFDEEAEIARQKLLNNIARKKHIDFLSTVFVEVCESLEEKSFSRDKPGFLLAAAELTSIYFSQVPR